MKDKLLILGILIICFALCLSFYNARGLSLRDNSSLKANLEALTQQEEAVIVCDSGGCGQCYMERTAWPFYRCILTGYQDDYCDCNKPGWVWAP